MSKNSSRRGSVFVDGDKLKSLRHALGLTQEQAAARAGYTDRLIRKLERGGPVSPQTVRDMAEAYAAAVPKGASLTPQDLMVATPAAELERLVRTWFHRAYNERDLAVIAEMMHPDIVLHSEGATRQGREVIEQRVSLVLGAFQPLQLTVEKVICEKDHAVAYWSVVKTHVGDFLGIPATGKEVTLMGSSWARFEQGLIVEVRDHWDVQDLIQKLTGNPSRPV